MRCIEFMVSVLILLQTVSFIVYLTSVDENKREKWRQMFSKLRWKWRQVAQKAKLIWHGGKFHEAIQLRSGKFQRNPLLRSGKFRYNSVSKLGELQLIVGLSQKILFKIREFFITGGAVTFNLIKNSIVTVLKGWYRGGTISHFWWEPRCNRFSWLIWIQGDRKNPSGCLEVKIGQPHRIFHFV